MQKIVIDACVFAKLFLDEEGFEKVRKFIKKICKQNVEIFVPSVFTYEIFHIAQKYNVDLAFITTLLKAYKAYNLKEIAIDDEIITAAKEIIRKSSNPKSGFPSFYDSVYHAIAIQNNCDFITIDRPHFTKTKHIGHVKMFDDINILTL
jgi:predicted nucleic acid-binding protein